MCPWPTTHREKRKKKVPTALWREGHTPKTPKSETETQNGTQGDPTQDPKPFAIKYINLYKHSAAIHGKATLYLVVPLRSDQPSGISRWEPYLVWLSLNVSRGFPFLFCSIFGFFLFYGNSFGISYFLGFWESLLVFIGRLSERRTIELFTSRETTWSRK